MGFGAIVAGFSSTISTFSGGGTVTTFSAGNLSPLFTTSVATASTTPALSFSLNNQAANTFFAGATSGGASAPTFRAIVDADIANAIVIGKVLTGYVSGVGVVSATDSILQAIQKLNGNIAALVTGVSSVSGTLNRITTSPTTGAVVVDIAATYVGQASITTLGIITTGTWNATPIATAYGGTNITTYATGDTLYASAPNVLSALPIGASGFVLTVVGGIPQWATTAITGITTLNTLTAQVQTFATGTTGTDFNIVSAVSTHTFNIPSSSAINRGLLTPADWTTFNNKQNALTFGNLTDAGTDGIVITGGTGAVIGTGTSIAQHVADATHNGYLSSTDWSTFNSAFHLPALTAGSVVFSDGTTLAQDNANFFWDDTNNYLGVGANSSLSARVHIKGVGNASTTFTLKALDSTNVTYFSLRDDHRLIYVDGNQASGFVLTSDASGIATWQATAITGITTLNGLTAQVQTFATGTTGTDFNIVSAVSTHTFNIPSSSAVNRGLLTAADWSTFNGKFTLPALTSGSVIFSNGTTLVQDNTNFFWDNTNKYLGIGTNTTLSASVHIKGTGATSATFALKAFDSANVLYFSLRNDHRIVYVDGNQAVGKILTTDANGVATWGYGNSIGTVVAVADGATITIDASLGSEFTVTLGGNRTLTITNPTSGQRIIFRPTQDATGSRTITLDANFRYGTDIPLVVLSTGASLTDYVGFVYNAAAAKWDVTSLIRGF